MLTELENRKKVVQANDTLRVSMILMDGVQRAIATPPPVAAAGHRPGFAVLSDEDRTKRAALVADGNKALSDRWKNPAPLPPDFLPKAPVEVRSAPAATKDAAYQSYDERLAMRWRAA